jgi:hypothetical protein
VPDRLSIASERIIGPANFGDKNIEKFLLLLAHLYCCASRLQYKKLLKYPLKRQVHKLADPIVS